MKQWNVLFFCLFTNNFYPSVAAEKVTFLLRAHGRQALEERQINYSTPWTWQQAALVWRCRVIPTLLCRGSEFLCRKPGSTVMIRVPFHTTPIHWHSINDSTLNTGPTGYPSTYRLQATLGDVLHSSQEEECGYSLGWASSPFREIDSWVQSKISVSSIMSLQLLKIDRKCYGIHSCCFQWFFFFFCQLKLCNLEFHGEILNFLLWLNSIHWLYQWHLGDLSPVSLRTRSPLSPDRKSWGNSAARLLISSACVATRSHRATQTKHRERQTCDNLSLPGELKTFLQVSET